MYRVIVGINGLAQSVLGRGSVFSDKQGRLRWSKPWSYQWAEQFRKRGKVVRFDGLAQGKSRTAGESVVDRKAAGPWKGRWRCWSERFLRELGRAISYSTSDLTSRVSWFGVACNSDACAGEVPRYRQLWIGCPTYPEARLLSGNLEAVGCGLRRIEPTIPIREWRR